MVKKLVGKQIVFLLLALLLVFGVVASAEENNHAVLVANGDKSYYLCYESALPELSAKDIENLCALVDQTSWNQYGVAIFSIPNGGSGGKSDLDIWDTDTDTLKEMLKVNTTYKLKIKSGVDIVEGVLGLPKEKVLYENYDITINRLDEPA